MPSTGLKIVGARHVCHGVASPLLFKTVWRLLGIEVRSFGSFGNLVPFLPDIDFQLLKSSWSSLAYFLFNDAPNALYRWKIWTAGRPIQHPNSSTTSHAVVIHKAFPEIDVIWRGAYVALKIIYLSAFTVPSKTCKLPILYALMHPHTIRDAGFWTECW